jgi:dihydroorotate dehydrogenase
MRLVKHFVSFVLFCVANALINRLGFNNVGVDAFVANLRRTNWRGVLGVNIGKNFDTPN